MKQKKLLVVTTDYFVAGAEFEKVYHGWSCVRAAPIIKWMKGKNPDRIKLDLLRMGANWEWRD